jgi:mRNA interferase RelE/StbE
VRIQSAVETVIAAQTLQDIPHLIKLQGGGNFYRLRVEDYRLGLSVKSNEVTFVRCLDRSQIYKQFP